MSRLWFFAALWLCMAASFLLLGRSRAAGTAAGGADVPAPGPDEGFFRVPINANPPTLDPTWVVTVVADGISRRIFNTLVRHSPDGPGGSLVIRPDLAESFELSADGRRYTFRLRPGVRFHNGREVTARDVKWSLERLAFPDGSERLFDLDCILGARAFRESALRWRRSLPPGNGVYVDWSEAGLGIEGIRVLDDRTVEIELGEPFAPFLSLMALTPASILPKEEVLRRKSDFGRFPVGTGPFRMAAHEPNSHILLERFDGYFEGPARLKGIFYRVVRENPVALQEYRAGRFDISPVPMGMLREIRSDPSLSRELSETAGLSTAYLGINMESGPAAGNVHLRRAMAFAIDREYLCSTVLGGAAVPAKGVLPPGMPAYDPGLEGQRYDPDAARRELEAAGFPGGKGLPPLRLYYRADGEGRLVCQAIQMQLRRASISVDLRPLEWGTFLARTRRGECPMFRLAWVADYPHPHNFLHTLFHSSLAGEMNRTRTRDPEVDRLTEAALREAGPAKSAELYRAAERRVLELAPWIVLYHGKTNLLIKPYVRGIRGRITPLDVDTVLPGVDFLKVEMDSVPESGGRR
ncbi:MAG: ABC transporter substrate-binding protein [Planctomycetota bacterium]|nr:ABC transporter substrate-binding protein [Planctomycetota bacterium]